MPAFDRIVANAAHEETPMRREFAAGQAVHLSLDANGLLTLDR